MKRFIKKLLALALVGVLSVPAWAQSRLLPVYGVNRDDNKISISFDAAWGNEDTQKLIDILAAHGIKVTFFVVGQWARKYPESVKALAEAGHEIMNHSDTHPYLTHLSPAQIKSEISGCNKSVAEVTGVEPTLIRVPYGDYDNKVIEAVNQMGMTAVQWDVDSLDWKELLPEEIFRRVTSSVHSGSIVLFHNAAKYTPDALDSILCWFEQNNYQVVPISQLLLTGDYTIDQNGVQNPA